MKNPPAVGAWCHIEIPVSDTGKGKAFYEACFGWKFTHVEGMDYPMFDSGEGGIGGGLMKRPEGAPQQMVAYLNVDDVEAYTERVTSNGGKLIMGKTEVPGAGWFTIVTDPDGNAFGLWQSMAGKC